MTLHEDLGAVRREIVLDADRDAVWALVGGPEGLATWLAEEVELDAVEPGARGTVRDGGEDRAVTIEEVDAGRRLTLSWCARSGDPTLVELTLDEAQEGGTRLVVVEVPLQRLRAVSDGMAARAGAARGPRMAAAA
jgi:uncharacterized protein YndB with AHSA1/START domain